MEERGEEGEAETSMETDIVADRDMWRSQIQETLPRRHYLKAELTDMSATLSYVKMKISAAGSRALRTR